MASYLVSLNSFFFAILIEKLGSSKDGYKKLLVSSGNCLNSSLFCFSISNFFLFIEHFLSLERLHVSFFISSRLITSDIFFIESSSSLDDDLDGIDGIDNDGSDDLDGTDNDDSVDDDDLDGTNNDDSVDDDDLDGIDNNDSVDEDDLDGTDIDDSVDLDGIDNNDSVDLDGTDNDDDDDLDGTDNDEDDLDGTDNDDDDDLDGTDNDDDDDLDGTDNDDSISGVIISSSFEDDLLEELDDFFWEGLFKNPGEISGKTLDGNTDIDLRGSSWVLSIFLVNCNVFFVFSSSSEDISSLL